MIVFTGVACGATTRKSLEAMGVCGCVHGSVLYSLFLIDVPIPQATVSDDVTNCTYLVADSVKRTVKFLSGLSVCTAVVKTTWVEACTAAGKVGMHGDGCLAGLWVLVLTRTPVQLISPSDPEFAQYTLRDPENEDKFGFDLPSSLAKAHEAPMLKGRRVHDLA